MYIFIVQATLVGLVLRVA